MAKQITSIAKITRPKLSGIVARERLFRHIDRGKEKSVTWVAAQAGSGKTTLAASYLDSRRLPCIWYQVDAGDGDVASFFYYLGMAARKAAPRYRTALPLLKPEYLGNIPVFTRRYFEELFNRLISSNRLSRSNRFCIVLDNYHDAPLESGFHDMISHALETVPEGIHVIILSRNSPPQQLARLQANNRLQLIEWNDVRFTPEESGELLKAQGQERNDKRAVALLHQKTEGWAAGLVLLTAGKNAQAFDEKGPDRVDPANVFDYFANEIFRKTDEAMQDLLLKTSFLQRIEPGDGEQLTGNNHASLMLERLSKNHYFTQRYGRSFQYHPLFREFLLAGATARFSSDDISLIRRKAAVLLEKTGRVPEATALSLDAHDWARAERLVLDQSSTLVAQGRSKTLEEWLRRLPEDRLASSSWLCYWLGVCRLAYGPVEARGYFERAFLRFEKDDDVPGLFLSWAYIIDTFLYEWGDFKPLDHWIAVADKLSADHPEFPSPEIEARFTAGMLNALTWRQPGNPYLPAWAEKAWRMVLQHRDSQLRLMLGNHLVFYHLWIREFKRAGVAIEVLCRANRSEGNNQLMQQHWHAMEAIHSWLAADRAACLQAVKNGMRIGEESGIHLLDLSILAQGVLGGVTLGDPAAADDYLQKMSKISSPRILDKGLYLSLVASVAWQHGDLKKAIEQGRLAVTMTEVIGCPMPHSTCLMELAVSLFDDGQYEEAKSLLERGGELARGIHTLEFVHRMHGARFALDLGEGEHGLALLKRGLALGSQEGYVNMYRWNDGVMSRLCAVALEHGIESAYVRRLIAVRKLAPPKDATCPDAWPYPVRITTLGRFEVQRDGQPVPFAGKKKQLDLLKVLVALGGSSIREELAADILWPGAEGDDSHNSFKMTLSRLRGLVGNETVLNDEGLFSLNPGMVRMDAWDFERICDAAVALWGRREKSKDRISEAAGLTGKAFALYQGSFLPDDAGHGWTVSLRERLRGKLLRLAMSAGRYYEDKGKWKTAAGYYEKGLEADPLREEFYQRLMICHLKLGQRGEAAAVYHRCCSELSALNIVPSVKTVQINESAK